MAGRNGVGDRQRRGTVRSSCPLVRDSSCVSPWGVGGPDILFGLDGRGRLELGLGLVAD